MDPSDFKVAEIYIAAGHNYWVYRGEKPLQHGICRVSSVECVAGRGLRGDRYFSDKLNHRGQVTLMTRHAVDEIRREFALPKLPASVFRRNFIVEGPQLRDCLGARFYIQGIEFEGTQECAPCQWMDRMVAAGAKRFMADQFRGGLRARILGDGIITAVDVN